MQHHNPFIEDFEYCTLEHSLSNEYQYYIEFDPPIEHIDFDPPIEQVMSSATYSPGSSSVPDLIADTSINLDDNEFAGIFDFDRYSDTHSPKTVSPHRTPSPSLSTHIPLALSRSSKQPLVATGSGSSLFDFNINYQPDTDFFKIKEEPVEPIDWSSFLYGSETTDMVPANPIDSEAEAVPARSGRSIFSKDTDMPPSAPLPPAAGPPKDQQEALDRLMADFMEYTTKFGVETEIDAKSTNLPPPPTTIEPSLLFSSSPTNTSGSGPSSTSYNNQVGRSGSNTASYTTPATTLPPISENDSDHEEPLRSVHDDRAPSVSASAGPSRPRHSSVLSSTSDIASRLDRLEPREAIFSAGKGKGGKKGGGLSSVVRGDDEDLDDDDSWRPSPEEYKKLSSKEKRQLRNKLSARAFRTRRKDYIGTLEGHIKDRDDVIDEMRTQLISHKIENEDLRKELQALKASTLQVLHPESAFTLSKPAPLLSTFTLPPAISSITTPSAPPSKKRMLSPAPTPKFNPRKDLPSSSTEATRSFWGNDNMFGGGSTICHHTFVPPPVFKASQTNMNPLIDSSSTVAKVTDESKDISKPFSEWSDTHDFNLRSMDSYRMQMWSRLTREAQLEKDNIPISHRPKFLNPSSPSSSLTPSTSTSSPPADAALAAQIATAATSHITTKLAASFWSALSNPSGMDNDKLAAVVTGTAKLAVVPTIAHTYVPAVAEMTEKHAQLCDSLLADEALTSLMDGLKLHTPGTHCRSMTVREDPLGALGNFIKFCPTGA